MEEVRISTEDEVEQFDDDHIERSTIQRDEADEAVHRHKIEVIQKLLNEFDMEETMIHYRSLNSVKHSLDPKDLSFDSEMAGLKVKSHLESLMGTDVIKLNDRQYMLSLQDRLQKEYNTLMDKQEELRCEKERRRQRRLYIDGLQDLPNLDQHGVAAKSLSEKSANGRKATAETSHPPKTRRANEDEAPCDDPLVILVGSPNPARKSKCTAKDIRTRQPTKHARGSSQHDDDNKSDKDKSETTSAGPREDETAWPDNSPRAKLMKQLRQENSVRGLYRTADMVLAAPIADLDSVHHTDGSPRESE